MASHEASESQVALESMSDRQRRLVEAHLPLVRLTIARYARCLPPRRIGTETAELQQEGCLALMEAVRTHDPLRHGEFAAFAMARIRFAISRFVHEHRQAIRVPFITQRRRRSEKEDPHGRHRPDALPRALSFQEISVEAKARPGAPPDLSDGSPPDERPTIGDAIRQRVDLAARLLAASMERSSRCKPDGQELIRQCLEGRWAIPEPEERTSIRQIAKRVGCTVSRVTHCEERFHRRLREGLSEDAACVKLLALARQSLTGMRRPLSQNEVTTLYGLEDAAGAAGHLDAP